MATYFSDHFGADGTSDTSLSVGMRAGPGKAGAPFKIISAFCVADTGNGDVIRFFTLNSGVRLWRLFYASTAGGAGTIDLGLYLSGNAHDGAAVDDDLYASAIAITNAVALTDEILESATLTEADRGKYVWQHADAGAATLTADPFVNYDLCGVTDTGVGQSTTFYLEAWIS